MKYRPPCGTKPCTQCPFRRSSPVGWLGSGSPESFIVEITMERPLPCHPTIDYSDPSWLDLWCEQSIGKMCAGSLIMAANMGKLPRDPNFPRLPVDRVSVFATHQEFSEHHRSSKIRSWETEESREKRK